MTTIQLESKTYELKDTLLVKEYSRLMDRLKFIIDFQEKVKTGTVEELEKLGLQINSISVEDHEFVKNVIKRCFVLTDDEVENMHNTDLIQLFDEVRKESTQLKKK